MKKRDGRKIPREAMEYMRIQAIKLIKENKKVDEIAEFFGVTKDAVYKWIRKHKKKGIIGLKSKKAPGAKPKLAQEERKILVKLIMKPATEFGFIDPLWDCKRISKLIFYKLNKKLDYTNVWRLLQKMGISNQVPEKDSLEKDEKEVKRWIKEEWPKIQKHRRKWQAMLYFQDECGVSLIPVLGKTWAPKGKTPKVKVTGKRGCLIVTAAASTSGRLVFRIEKERINAERHIEFLQQILNRHPNRKIIVVEDNAPVHKSKKVLDFVKQHKKRFALYKIPSYSPDLNFQEDVWRYLKHVKLKAHQAQSLPELKNKIIGNMTSIRQKKGLVRSFFYANILY